MRLLLCRIRFTIVLERHTGHCRQNQRSQSNNTAQRMTLRVGTPSRLADGCRDSVFFFLKIKAAYPGNP